MNTSTLNRKVLICDNHELYCLGLRDLLKSHGFWVETSFTSSECSNHLKTTNFDVFICDLNIDEKDGFEIIELHKMQLKNTKIYIVSAYSDSYLINKSISMNVTGFLPKEIETTQLIKVINSFSTYFPSNNGQSRANDQMFYKKDQQIVNVLKLSKQEKKIANLILDGYTSQMIADELFISKNTVDTHRTNINRKLEISNATSLIQYVQFFK
jgi:two-component system, NarL family, nitrate/nitrite response regulator NarL